MTSRIKRIGLNAGVGIVTGLVPACIQPALSLPPPRDVPEEVLRTEVFTGGRSPIDGNPLTAAEYAQLQTQLRALPAGIGVTSDTKQLIFLLRIRKLIRSFAPFLPLRLPRK